MRKKSKVFARYKSKHKKAVDVAAESDHDDEELSEMDMDLLEEYGDYAGFLRDLNPTALIRNEIVTKTAKKLKTRIATSDSEDDEPLNPHNHNNEDSDQSNNSGSDSEVDYEAGPRALKPEWQPASAESKRLPAFGVDGKLIRLDKKKDLSATEELTEAKEKQRKKNEAKLSPQKKDTLPESTDASAVQAPPKDQGLKKEKPQKEKKLSFKAMTPQMRIQARWDAQELLAELASAIIENPEEKFGNLKQMREFGDSQDPTIQKFGLLSQLTVYRDIIPGYRIRALTEAEKTIVVTKDVKKVRNFEEGLLNNYQVYLQQLETNLRKHSSNGPGSDGSVAIVAMQCMTELLTTVTHFNFRVNLLSAIVSKMGSKSPVEVGAIACNGISKLFDGDVSGEPSLEAVKLMARMIKNKDYRVDEAVLKTFMHLRLKDEMALPEAESDPNKKHRNDKNKRKRDKFTPHVSKKMRKVQKKEGEVESELKEAEATYSQEEKQKNHSETLKFVFLTYFRILKNAETSPLIPSVLEGLSFFGHLINVDFYADLLTVLKKITISQYDDYSAGSSAPSATAKTSLHCIVAALLLLSGQGEAVNIDLKDFNTSLYCQLSRLPMLVSSSDARIMDGADEARAGVERDSVVVKRLSDVHSRSEIELVLMGLDLLFCRKKQIQIDRCAAFIKRLASISLHLKPNAVLACLSLQRALFVKHSRLQQLLDPEERLGTGIYKPYLDDSELCNPFATNLWELSYLMNHYHPTVRQFARHLANTQSSTTANVTGTKSLPPELNMTPTNFLKKYNTTPEYPTPTFVFVPPVSEPQNVTAAVKRRREQGKSKLNHVLVDGPGIVDPSDFLGELEDVDAKDELKMRAKVKISEKSGDVLGGGFSSEVTKDPIVAKLIRREKRLRKLVEMSRELTLDLLPEDDDGEDDEFDEEYDEDDEGDEEQLDDDGTSGFPSLPAFGGKGGKRALSGSQRAEQFIASLKRK
ncbi:CBF/Mak21 family-domain-containing protein [Obelidium mucronatum]|nr:CBF/Mak21 family-domain-containing protein [Obelidium mucronatum]